MGRIIIQWSWDLVSIEYTRSPSFLKGWGHLSSCTRGGRWWGAAKLTTPTKTGKGTW